MGVRTEQAWVSEQEKGLNTTAAEIPTLAAQQRLSDLNAQYKSMAQKRNSLQATYLNADASSKPAAATALKKQLQLMYDNRVAAEHEGSKTAKREAAGLQMVIQHLE